MKCSAIALIPHAAGLAWSIAIAAVTFVSVIITARPIAMAVLSASQQIAMNTNAKTGVLNNRISDAA